MPIKLVLPYRGNFAITEESAVSAFHRLLLDNTAILPVFR